MKAVVLAAMIGVLLSAIPSEAQTPGKWMKRAAFPEPSEELVGASVGGKFYVFGGLGPGWGPQGLVYEYDPTVDKWTKKQPMALPAHHVAFTELNGKCYAFGALFRPSRGHLHGCRSITHGKTTRRQTAGKHWPLCRRNAAQPSPPW